MLTSVAKGITYNYYRSCRLVCRWPPQKKEIIPFIYIERSRCLSVLFQPLANAGHRTLVSIGTCQPDSDRTLKINVDFAAVSSAADNRTVPSRFPPIDLYERVAAPDDWDLLQELEGETSAKVSPAM
ncbi:hypothetical protein C1H69_14645 [Billgrantia endophytica]|uniref:Uncharacterized protein n=1 Tax=Billgrantia endophytica TaxID=2033802 RepID=A0A2N7U210_9GAMM|nr:hypothetical protein C1H69_14645 [Halomonas endophytica]